MTHLWEGKNQNKTKENREKSGGLKNKNKKGKVGNTVTVYASTIRKIHTVSHAKETAPPSAWACTHIHTPSHT
jgi:hypothetical protein